MADFPIVADKTAMLFFDCLSGGLHPEEAEKQAVVNSWGIFEPMQKIERACRAAGIPIFYTQIDHRADLKDIAPLIVDSGADGQRGGAHGSLRAQPPRPAPGSKRSFRRSPRSRLTT